MHALTYADLAGLFDRRLLVHTMFELVMLGAQGVELPDVVDTMQLASLTLGCADGVRRLDNVAKESSGSSCRRTCRRSYWSARNLSDAQLVYAAGDPVVTYRAGRRMYQLLGDARAAGVLAGEPGGAGDRPHEAARPAVRSRSCTRRRSPAGRPNTPASARRSAR